MSKIKKPTKSIDKKTTKESADKKPTFTRETLEAKNVVANHTKGRFVVTAAVQNAYVNVHFLRSLENYCTANDATLIILGMKPHQRPLEKQEEFYDSPLTKYFKSGQLVTNYRFNSNLVAFDLRNVPQLADPLAGLAELALENGERISVIVAAPVQSMKVLPGKVGSLPRIAHSTGVVTRPTYQATRPGKLAEQRHIYGALVLEIDDEVFHLRQLQAHSEDNSVIDLGTRYFESGEIREERAEAIEAGDIHAGETDPMALQFLQELCTKEKPRRLFVQDVFTGASVNHHIIHKILERSMVPKHIATLELELAVCGQTLNILRSYAPKDAICYVKESNHDYFLSNYLSEMRFKEDVQNVEIALELAVKVRAGYNPLAYATDPEGEWTWLSSGASIKVEGVEMSQHGHAGLNGARGNLSALSKAYGACFAGHSPGIHPGGCYQVGTSTYLRLSYNGRGASTWLQTHGVLYKGGQRQLVTLIDTKWRA